MFAVSDILVDALIAGVLAGALLFVWPWTRRRGCFAVAAISTFAGFTAWNLVLNSTHGSNFNVDAPVIGLSWADAGSGVLAFVATALVLGLALERTEPAGRVIGAAAIAGVVAMGVDLFVL
ncbi:MAG TPA: hypothetical protein VIM45_03030 [Dehalococcoidia bacterium]|jgi:hypothetical protein